MNHTELAQGRWFTLSLAEQLGNVGSEYERAISWKQRADTPKFEKAFDRFLELLDLTVNNPELKSAQKRELLRIREVACEELTGEKNEKQLGNYFMQFALLARAGR